MKYIIVSPEDLRRIVIATVNDAGDAASAVQSVPKDQRLPDRVAAIPMGSIELLVVVGPNDPMPSIVQRAVDAPVPVPDFPAPPADTLVAPYDGYTKQQLADAIVARGLDLPTTGSGADGAVVKADLIAVLEADDATKTATA